ncbi:MAG: DUF4238 domain-containing protein [Paracoccaceae bacterium]|nr:DUF4238 domain-containing protein [Paracoccaceae bacterium]
MTDDDAELHIDLREEMILELARLQIWLGERVVEQRINNRPPNTINPEVEREACLGPKGADTISRTARMAYDHVWKKITDERWKPKSTNALKRAKNPRKAKLAVKPVAKNHFIPRWFLKDNWATDDLLRRWQCTKKGWTSSPRNFGKWGFRHALYSDQLEAYFALLEGDAKRPVEMLLDTRPLNGPQREAFVGFLIIQMLRNPHFIETIEKDIALMIAEGGHDNVPKTARQVYETLFQNNELYNRFAQPIIQSRWAIVKSNTPIFVLPDRFSLQEDLGDGLRTIVPLTPKACFVTLLDREVEKRVVPYFLLADEALARRISATLIAGSKSEFVSHPDFVPDLTNAAGLNNLLSAIGDAITTRLRSRGELE